MQVYNFETEIEDGRYKGQTIRQVFEKHHDFIFKTIKRWAANGVQDKEFSDDVLTAANIKRSVSNFHTYQEDYVCNPKKEITSIGVKLKKDTKTVDEIFDEMEAERNKSKMTLENQSLSN